MKYKGVNYVTIPFDDHFYSVLELIADYIGKNSQGKVAADVETTTQLLVIRGIHDLRSAYACERYEQLTGFRAPVLGGNAPRDLDREAP